MSAIRGLMAAIIFALAVGYYTGHWGHPKSINPVNWTVKHPARLPSPRVAVSPRIETVKAIDTPAIDQPCNLNHRQQAYQIGLEFNQEFGAEVDRFTGMEMKIEENSYIAPMNLRLYGVRIPTADHERWVLVPELDSYHPGVHSFFSPDGHDTRNFAILSDRYNYEIKRHLRLGRISHDRGYAEWYKRIILTDKI